MVRAGGTSTAGRFLVLNTLPLDKTSFSRFGIITTKRLGHAVVRNKLRRRMREILREHAQPLAQGFFVVIVLRAAAAQVDYKALESDFLYLLRRQLRKITA